MYLVETRVASKRVRTTVSKPYIGVQSRCQVSNGVSDIRENGMLRQLVSSIGLLLRLVLILIAIAILLALAYAAYRGAQPMQIPDAQGMTYWQFLEDRIQVISTQPVHCQRLYIVSFVIGVPVYPVLYTYVGKYPDSYLARHTMPHSAIPQGITWKEAPRTWWLLVEQVSWEALVRPNRRVQVRDCPIQTPAYPGK
jgi:hypothetical protein